eukprot:comp19418_c0_seq1/m.22502 comp19418_c0_seq1/g.22502  ORF comp19418_c0_seq1/g.22502 comp19418_c0_seq1/m.22502 type:complete len:716 (-) comp19418_c0_seq1:183-2330(-)
MAPRSGFLLFFPLLLLPFNVLSQNFDPQESGRGAIWQFYYVGDDGCRNQSVQADASLTLINRCAQALLNSSDSSGVGAGFKTTFVKDGKAVLHKYKTLDCQGLAKPQNNTWYLHTTRCNGWSSTIRNGTKEVSIYSQLEYEPYFDIDERIKTALSVPNPPGVLVKIYKSPGCNQSDLVAVAPLFEKQDECEPNRIDPIIYNLNNVTAPTASYFRGYVLGDMVVYQAYLRATCALAVSPDWQAGRLNQCTLDWDGMVSYMYVRVDPPTPPSTIDSQNATGTGVPDPSAAGNVPGSTTLPLAVILGISLGSAAALILFIATCIYCKRRQRSKKLKHESDSRIGSPPVLPGQVRIQMEENIRPLSPQLSIGGCPRPGWICKDDFKVLGPLGQGNFGTVSKGILRHHNREYDVAIKKLSYRQANGALSLDMRKALIKEAETMMRLEHSNVVGCHGLHMDMDSADGLFVLMEYMAMGDLHTHLVNSKKNKKTISRVERLWYVREVSKGLAYLADNKICHRDVAARNVLLGDPTGNPMGYPVVKVSDFGLSEKVDGNFWQGAGGQLPVRWLAPECLDMTRQLYSEKSDVYSYGVLVWEVFTDGAVPWNQFKDIHSVIRAVMEGRKMDIPKDCPERPPIKQLIRTCWETEMDCRPTFQQILALFEAEDVHPLRRSSLGSRGLPPIPSDSTDGYDNMFVLDDPSSSLDAPWPIRPAQIANQGY